MALLPLLVSVTVFAAPVLPNATLPHVSEVGDALAVPPVDVVPVPESATMSAVELEELLIVQDAVMLPVAAGLNETEAVQLAEAASEEPQVVVEVKSAVSVPVIPAPLSVTVLEVPFLTVTV